MPGAAVLVPVKGFREAKVRLAPALSPDARAALARSMAERVLAAAAPLRVAVVCDDPDVAEWAGDRGALVVWAPGLGLNGAVEAGVVELAGDGFDEVIVAHADLPLAEALGALAGSGGVTLVPDRRDDGTNVCVVPAAAGFRFAYGPGSFTRHRAEAVRLGLAVRVARPDALTLDIDVPADLETAGLP